MQAGPSGVLQYVYEHLIFEVKLIRVRNHYETDRSIWQSEPQRLKDPSPSCYTEFKGNAVARYT